MKEGNKVDKKTAKVLTALVIPTAGAISVTGSVPLEAKMISGVMSKENLAQQTVNYQQVITIDDSELSKVIKNNLSIPEQNDITLGDMHRLTSLEIGFAYEGEITSLKGLENAINLEQLTIKTQSIQDMSIIGSLTGLKELDLSGNDLGSIDFLASLTNLETLKLGNTRISDVSVLENLNQLKKLQIENNNISDISPLADLVSLEVLDASNNVIEDLPKFSDKMTLRELNLSTNMTLSDISPLKDVTSLEKLSLSFTDLESLEDLSSLKKIRELEFVQTKVNDLTPLETLKNLEIVRGDGTRVHDLRPVAHVGTISFHNLSLESIAEVNSEYLTIPIYGTSGELIPVTSSSQGEWDSSKQAFKLSVVPINGDVIEVNFGDNKTISGKLNVKVIIEELDSPIVLVDQNTGRVVIKSTSDNATVYYRESSSGDWIEYKGAFNATPISYSGGKANYHIEAKQMNFFGASEIAVNEFSISNQLNPVIYNFKWWTSGDAAITAKHTDEDAEIMYRFANGDWQRYTGQINLTSYYQAGKVEMQFYAKSVKGDSPVTNFSILKAPTVEGVSGENKIKITHPLPKVNIYYRVNGGDWLPYTGEFEFEKAGEYSVEAYVEEAGIESPISVPVTVKTSGQSGSSTNDVEQNNSQNGDSNQTSGNSSGSSGSTSGQSSSTSGSKDEGKGEEQNGNKNPETGVNAITSIALGGASVLGGLFMFIKRRK